MKERAATPPQSHLSNLHKQQKNLADFGNLNVPKINERVDEVTEYIRRQKAQEKEQLANNCIGKEEESKPHIYKKCKESNIYKTQLMKKIEDLYSQLREEQLQKNKRKLAVSLESIFNTFVLMNYPNYPELLANDYNGSFYLTMLTRFGEHKEAEPIKEYIPNFIYKKLSEFLKKKNKEIFKLLEYFKDSKTKKDALEIALLKKRINELMLQIDNQNVMLQNKDEHIQKLETEASSYNGASDHKNLLEIKIEQQEKEINDKSKELTSALTQLKSHGEKIEYIDQQLFYFKGQVEIHRNMLKAVLDRIYRLMSEGRLSGDMPPKDMLLEIFDCIPNISVFTEVSEIIKSYARHLVLLHRGIVFGSINKDDIIKRKEKQSIFEIISMTALEQTSIEDYYNILKRRNNIIFRKSPSELIWTDHNRHLQRLEKACGEHTTYHEIGVQAEKAKRMSIYFSKVYFKLSGLGRKWILSSPRQLSHRNDNQEPCRRNDKAI